MTRRTPIPWISVVLTALPAVALLGSLALQTGCATKTGCFNCHINGVMANPSEPSAAPSSELTIQLETPSSSPVTTVKVNMENEDGKTESVKYDGSQVSGISSTAVTPSSLR